MFINSSGLYIFLRREICPARAFSVSLARCLS
nr:MAG TPA: hypothetical protein [Caudoviricetes sp.]